MVEIVAVHGIGNYQAHLSPEAAAWSLGQSWLASLGEALGEQGRAPRVSLTAAYYAHALREPGAQSGDGVPGHR